MTKVQFKTSANLLKWEKMESDFFTSITDLVLVEESMSVDVYLGISYRDPNPGKWYWCVMDIEQEKYLNERLGFDSKEEALADLVEFYG